MGAVVLKMGGPAPDLARRLRVIDGQQRLTTIQLLIAAIVTELNAAGLPGPADRLRELATNSPLSASLDKDSYKITHQRRRPGHHYERFSDVMRAALTDGDTEGIDGPMAECYRFFRKAVHDWLVGNGTQTAVAASALVTTLILKLNLVGIYLDTHEKEHAIFETLNARGERLTEWDKIKNYLLYKADAEPGVDQESFFENFLDRFDEHWWREWVGRGVQSRPRTDVFADYWLESQTKTDVEVRQVFRKFQRYVDQERQNLEPTMKAFVQDARYFEWFERPEAGAKGREALFHNRRLEMAVGAIWPLLLELQRMSAAQSERDRWFAALESYFVRRMIAGYQARSYDRVTLEILRELPIGGDDGDKVADAVVKKLLQYEEPGSKWPKDSEVRDAVLTRHLPQYAQRLVLSAIEQRLITDRAGHTTLASTVQIEHIMPRGWQPTLWPLPESADPDLAQAERERVIETLGNLTLLKDRLNSSISNGPWKDKRLAIEESDNLFLNRNLLKESPSRWTEDDIRSRGEWMYSIIVDIWPRGKALYP